MLEKPHSSRGLGRSPLKAKTGVRISYGAHHSSPLKQARNVHFYTLDEAISYLLSLMYFDQLIPEIPQTNKTPHERQRNAKIKAKYDGGASVPDLAREYSISVNRVYLILGGKRK